MTWETIDKRPPFCCGSTAYHIKYEDGADKVGTVWLYDIIRAVLIETLATTVQYST